MATLPTSINEDTVPVLLSRIGSPLDGDGQLNLLGDMRLRLYDELSEAAVTTAMTNAGFSSPDAVRIVAWLRSNQATKGVGS